MRHSYDVFLRRYRRTNMTNKEYTYRFDIFKKNVELIAQLNAAAQTATNSTSSTVRFGVTQFADWSDDEYEKFTNVEQELTRTERGLYSKSKYYPYGPWKHVKWHHQDYPQSWDWREHDVVGRIKSQAFKCNSCWAYAVTGVVETLYAIKYGKHIDISEYEMLDCDTTNSGCTSGSTRRAMGRGLSHGFVYTKNYPKMLYSRNSCPPVGDVFVKQLYEVSPDAKTIAWFTSNFGPVALNVAIPHNYKFYQGGIMLNSYECSTMQANHAAEVVGYGVQDGIKYWIMKNSWGEGWGEGGYFRIERGKNTCLIESFATSAGV
ncbi:unnamed protein product [Anisakis simplex]|uniref:Cathepsin F (inferred by orthology to a S. mansoni protein) n=1 Tax=Anisakis simplex TaxID=6269 RepID=A0A0M3JQR3_ANISI|nr:unnamed protein product [Anisakis simplex]